MTEKYAVEIEALLHRWSDALKISAQDFSPLADLADPSIQSCSFVATKEIKVRSGPGPHIVKRQFAGQEIAGREGFLKAIQSWLGRPKQIETAEFEIYGLEELASSPLTLRVLIRYDVVATRPEDRREERVGSLEYRVDSRRLGPVEGAALGRSRRNGQRAPRASIC